MTYAEAIGFLNSLSRFGWRLGLERIAALCSRLGNPELSFDAIHVAGTNGKGSTATFLASILQAAGFRTGLYTSPHLYDGRERIRIDGESIAQEQVASLVEELVPLVREVSQQHGPLTEFEVWTALMFLHFQREGVKVAVIEAGLGGRWDSTNVIRPRLAILTNVSVDHTDRLGNTLAEIARDKAGIVKPEGRILTGPLEPEALEEVQREVAVQKAELYHLLSDRSVPGAASPEHTYLWEPLDRCSFALTDPSGVREILEFKGPTYQARNAALAAAAISVLGEGYAANVPQLQSGLGIQIPGRFEVVRQNPEVILDGAHNTAASALLAVELARGRLMPDGSVNHPPLRIVFGNSSGHDAEGCLRILAPLAVEVILTRARNPRSRQPQDLAPVAEGCGVPYQIVPDVAAAVEMAISRSGPEDRVCVTGSFFVLGETPRSWT